MVTSSHLNERCMAALMALQAFLVCSSWLRWREADEATTGENRTHFRCIVLMITKFGKKCLEVRRKQLFMLNRGVSSKQLKVTQFTLQHTSLLFVCWQRSSVSKLRLKAKPS